MTGLRRIGKTSIIKIFIAKLLEFIEAKHILYVSPDSFPLEKYLLESHFEKYMQMGGIPEYVLTDAISYLDNLIDNIIYKDIVSFYGVRDLSGIKNLFRLLMERTGKQMSINKLAKVVGLSPDTVRRYVAYFVQTYLVYTIERCGKLNERIRSPKKLYAADAGIRNHITGFRDKGAIFENLAYLKIKQKNPCYIYQNGLELDFLFQEPVVEVKYERELESKQKDMFEQFPAKHKMLIKGLDDYLALR